MDRKQFKALDEAIANLSRLLSTGGSELAHDRRLHKALDELKAYRKGGKPSVRRVHRAVELISQLICETLLQGAKEVR